MMKRLQASWDIFIQSWSVIARNKKLLVFPVAIFVMTTGILAFFLVPIVIQPTGHYLNEPAHWKAVLHSVFTEDSIERMKKTTPNQGAAQQQPVQLTKTATAYLTLIYFASMFFATFFNVAFYHEIFEALAGGTVSLQNGLAFALKRWKSIAIWSLFAGIVGYLLRLLEQKLGAWGRWAIRLIGISWSIASVFAIPALVAGNEVDNPLEVLRLSAVNLKKTWGENLTGYIGMGILNTLIFLALLCGLIGLVIIATYLSSPMMLLIGIAAWVIAFFMYQYVWQVAGAVFRCAVYRYAATGQAPQTFTSNSLNAAWKMQ